MNQTVDKWLGELKSQNLRALAQLVSAAENKDEIVWKVLAKVYPEIKGKGRILGITGPPGVGKSSLISEFVKIIRQRGEKVAVIAIDPESPFTRGSLLGDRVRMADHFNDKGVFIRSLSTRGKLGGVSLATREVLHLLIAFGFENVLIETVGVGQNEVDIKDIAQAVLLVLGPEWGDSIQMLKAGILEIADVFAVHKADKEGAEEVFNELNVLPELTKKVVKVIKTSRSDTAAIANLLKTLETCGAREIHEHSLFESLLQWQLASELDKGLRGLKNHKATGNPYQAALEFLEKHPVEKWLNS